MKKLRKYINDWFEQEVTLIIGERILTTNNYSVLLILLIIMLIYLAYLSAFTSATIYY